MVDRPPPSRFSVVERGGRLVVIDSETGQTPPTAAERMDMHDRKLGVEPIRPARPSAAPGTALRAEPGPGSRTAPPPRPATVGTAASDRNNGPVAAATERHKRPWTSQPNDRPAIAPNPARAAPQPTPPAADARKTIVTGKWWDSKGPRTVELGPKGQTELTGGFMALFFGLVIAAIVAFFVEPLLLFVGAFALFRFGGNFLGPIGARIVDKAIAERG
ncbi:hypothetical protein [Sphingopyxis sp. RIFCSPHIGHO2_12_FULL_65_19]|uniref:hypothetical protein n=1 Tax=Sphingopyxis sp. RIFCSPHIGHO2_12_FULL_65_19 TaxID=1802172 RepID=UPI000AB17975|nr:hypothetical protein [Sphingopyxis sp. RIFCSPHIGHO2_12_FULL_65_19]